MALREIWLMWVPEGLEPLASRSEGRISFQRINDAVAAALEEMDSRKSNKLLPWIRAGTGKGSALVNIQGILLLRAAYNEGFSDSKGSQGSK